MRGGNKLVYIVGGLMLATGAIYLHEAYVESQEFSTELAAQAETMFFSTAGILYLPFGIWMIKSKMASRAPYIISMAGSVMLILLYIASRTVNLPIVGLQEDVGVTDLASKALQAGIVAVCGILLAGSSRSKIVET